MKKVNGAQAIMHLSKSIDRMQKGSDTSSPRSRRRSHSPPARPSPPHFAPPLSLDELIIQRLEALLDAFVISDEEANLGAAAIVGNADEKQRAALGRTFLAWGTDGRAAAFIRTLFPPVLSNFFPPGSGWQGPGASSSTSGSFDAGGDGQAGSSTSNSFA